MASFHKISNYLLYLNEWFLFDLQRDVQENEHLLWITDNFELSRVDCILYIGTRYN